MPLTVGHLIDRAHPHPGGVVTATLQGVDVPVVEHGNAVRVRLRFDVPGTFDLVWLRDDEPWLTDTLRVLPADANQRNVRLG